MWPKIKNYLNITSELFGQHVVTTKINFHIKVVDTTKVTHNTKEEENMMGVSGIK